MFSKLILLQGVPGSGKSTFAQKLRRDLEAKGERVVICSTDDYFFIDGVYKFDPTKLVTNHRKNQHRVFNLLSNDYTVIVDNTNIQRWQAKPYVAFAVDTGIPVEFIRCSGNFTNVHGVPYEAVERMRNQMEILTVESIMNS